ncbi:prepilin-type N-terminal cleavage/methylation domain-containing protein [Oscillatoria acuminata]|uniref:Prepilin-type N-terminal cleavage/methylation domain-containing protein n=1 Tax=Oscillatoria acuminata PCC 6304 TaxID=56110 RepID=K9TEF2_9CYAN|nr:prepilin-type N-terminal cleavage/methylation domain-containing protein [Oscillatoria acuminata]AFY80526.1 prepilin-type N-terminal cleavage/methylation domain-containing protein [Oscillatoria acuminata PCC 6304]
MAKKIFQFLLNRRRVSHPKHFQEGFTLLELLASMMIVSVIITTILALVVDLLGTNQKETAQTETQQEMQRAIDYISSELREAIYIYDNRCFQGNASNPECRGIFNYLTIPANTVPVLAFWKLEPLPENCQLPSADPDDPCKDLRIGGRTYSLVVYYLSTHNPNNTWTGKARIARYQLDKFQSNTVAPELVAGYIDPKPEKFIDWPYQTGSHAVTHANLDILVDFVDVNNEDTDAECPASYELTPSQPFAQSKLGQSNLGFYSCIRQPEDKKAQDALIFIRGNANGKPGVTSDAYLPVLQTQVMRRSVFGLSGNE